MSKFFRAAKKQAAQKAPDPRVIDEIQKEYRQLATQSGEVQYQIYALEQNLEELNKQMIVLNHEGAARQKLDREAADKAKSEQQKEAQGEH